MTQVKQQSGARSTLPFAELRILNMRLTKQSIRSSIGTDDHIIQAIRAHGELQKVFNTVAKRTREWFELSAPEVSRMAPDNEKLITVVLETQSLARDDIFAQYHLAESASMGAPLEDAVRKDMISHAALAKATLFTMHQHEHYLDEMMTREYPSFTTLAGPLLGAKLIGLAGSMRTLALMPATTIQLLGAEKALFRHLRTKAKSPKHGVIIEHPLVARAKKGGAGKAARAIADKISIAVRVDFFKGKPIGEKLKADLAKRFGTW